MSIIQTSDFSKWLAAQGDASTAECEVSLAQYWLPDAPPVQFTAKLKLRAQPGGAAVVAVAFGSARGDRCELDLTQPLRLRTTHIPKPWGQEIWYTGVEERGVCELEDEGGGAVPLPWLLELLADRLTGGARQLILLKILDPLAAEVWGDLYFELHEEKREVYVVTRVDPTAWPDGVGAIRFGFDPERVASYADEAAFKAAYRESVASYEAVRREIDGLLDERRRSSGIALNTALGPEQLQQWQAELPPALMERERQLRAAMESFSLRRPLRVGDVVKVPCLTPHSLQHGVRTVEFQTPVYERKILSFGQKVLTQDHWDTEDAIALMQVQTPPDDPFVAVGGGGDSQIERIVDFDDFEVQRWRLPAGTGHRLDLAGRYALVMGVEGTARVGELMLCAEQACLAPATMAVLPVENAGGERLTLLVALPRT